MKTINSNSFFIIAQNTQKLMFSLKQINPSSQCSAQLLTNAILPTSRGVAGINVAGVQNAGNIYSYTTMTPNPNLLYRIEKGFRIF